MEPSIEGFVGPRVAQRTPALRRGTPASPSHVSAIPSRRAARHAHRVYADVLINLICCSPRSLSCRRHGTRRARRRRSAHAVPRRRFDGARRARRRRASRCGRQVVAVASLGWRVAAAPRAGDAMSSQLRRSAGASSPHCSASSPRRRRRVARRVRRRRAVRRGLRASRSPRRSAAC